jgi:hypothetical protein
MGFFERLGAIMDNATVYVAELIKKAVKSTSGVYVSVKKLVQTSPSQKDEPLKDTFLEKKDEPKNYMAYSKSKKYAKCPLSERCTDEYARIKWAETMEGYTSNVDAYVSGKTQNARLQNGARSNTFDVDAYVSQKNQGILA